MNEHGGNIFLNDVEYDFSANLNPLGIPENVKKAVMENISMWERYPDPDCTELRKSISEYEKFPFENIVCGNGAADLIYRIVQTIKPKKAVIPVPAFGEYRKALVENGCITEEYLLDRSDFVLKDDFTDRLTEDIDIIFLCNPNNPTGICISAELLGKIAEKCKEKHIYLICDECFLEFVRNGFSVRNFLNEYTIILKAFTKIFSIPGLRLGYALFGDNIFAGKVHGTGQFWSVSAPAQTAGTASLKETEYLEKTVLLIEEERKYLENKLLELGLKYYPSKANFIMFRAEQGLEKKMLAEKILIRSCANYTGLDGTYYRTAVRNRSENEIFISALRRCING